MEFLKCLFKSNKACLSHQEICDLIDDRITFHTRGDEMEQIIFGGQDSVWNAPHYAKLKGEVSEHLREAELDSVIVLIEHQRLKTLQIEELKLQLQLAQINPIEQGKIMGNILLLLTDLYLQGEDHERL